MNNILNSEFLNLLGLLTIFHGIFVLNSTSWNNSNLYNQFMGRWSVKVAQQFLIWLHNNHSIQKKSWIDVGCGTGALTYGILKYANREMV